VRFFLLLLFTVAISIATRDQLGRRRARTINSKYDLNPQLTVADNRTAYQAHQEQREREAWLGWDDEDADGERPPKELSQEELGLPADAVRVARFRDPAQAHLLRGRLESTGIAAAVFDNMTYQSIGYHDVYVAADAAEDALEVVADLRGTWGGES
jgi:hypothetical protein